MSATANMVIVAITPINEQKAADRLLENDLVILQGHNRPVLAMVKDAGFPEFKQDHVDITFNVVENDNSATQYEVNLVVPRKQAFTVVGLVTK